MVTAETRRPRNLNRRIREIYFTPSIPSAREPAEGGFDTPRKGDLRTGGRPGHNTRLPLYKRGIWQAGRISITRPKLVSRVVARSLPSAILPVPHRFRVSRSFIPFPPLPNRVNEKYRCSNTTCTKRSVFLRFNDRFNDRFPATSSVFRNQYFLNENVAI